MFWAPPPDPPPAVQLFAVEPSRPSTQAVDFSPFTHGAISVDFSASYTLPLYESSGRFFTGSFGMAYALFDHFTMSLDLNGDYMSVQHAYGGGGGFDLRGRLELFRWNDISVFIEGSAGLIESDHPVPSEGTHFNFCETAGFGAFIPLVPPRVYVEGGARFEHISNAGIGENPGYEGLQVYAGIMMRL